MAYGVSGYKIVCETANYIGYINAQPKAKYLNEKGIEIIDNALFKLTGLRIKHVAKSDMNGLVTYVYKRPNDKILSDDSHWECGIKFMIDNRVRLFACVGIDDFPHEDYSKQLFIFFCKYFDVAAPGLFYRYGLISTVTNLSKDNQYRRLLKHHSAYRCCGEYKIATSTSNTPIEKIFREELLRRGLKFEEQVDFIIDGKKFSRPDFILRDEKILIYCDGVKYHNTPERISMDKQQDRLLQIYGYCPMRFTGPEIISDVTSCVNQVVMLIKKMAYRQ